VIGGQEPQSQGENEAYRSEDAVRKKLASCAPAGVLIGVCEKHLMYQCS
jgi:hypothetical protein